MNRINKYVLFYITIFISVFMGVNILFYLKHAFDLGLINLDLNQVGIIFMLGCALVNIYYFYVSDFLIMMSLIEMEQIMPLESYVSSRMERFVLRLNRLNFFKYEPRPFTLISFLGLMLPILMMFLVSLIIDIATGFQYISLIMVPLLALETLYAAGYMQSDLANTYIEKGLIPKDFAI